MSAGAKSPMMSAPSFPRTGWGRAGIAVPNGPGVSHPTRDHQELPMRMHGASALARMRKPPRFSFFIAVFRRLVFAAGHFVSQRHYTDMLLAEDCRV